MRPELLVRWMGDFARLEAVDGGIFSVDINGVLIRGHFVRLQRPSLIEVAWGEAGNAEMPPGATRLVITLEPRGAFTTLRLEHTGLAEEEATKHAIGWPHFLERLTVACAGRRPGRRPVEGHATVCRARFTWQRLSGYLGLLDLRHRSTLPLASTTQVARAPPASRSTW